MLRGTSKKLRDAFRRSNMECQFWFYEIGNVVAAISGTGGFEKFSNNIDTVFSDPQTTLPQKILTMTSQYPDATVAIGIGAVAVIAPVAHSAVNRISSKMTPVANGVSAVAAGSILGYALAQDASLITVSASAFVVGSSLLRFALQNPFFLKAGGLALACGGVALSAFGIQNSFETFSGPQALSTILDAANAWDAVKATSSISVDPLTGITGAYVTAASLMTYEGGIYQTMGFKDDGKPLGSWASKLCHPLRGSLSQVFSAALDKPIRAINDFTKATMLAYIPRNMRDTKPFATSMWARLPFRVVTAVPAVLAGNFSFAAACLLWGGGDTAIGQEDYKKPAAENLEPATAPQ